MAACSLIGCEIPQPRLQVPARFNRPTANRGAVGVGLAAFIGVFALFGRAEKVGQLLGVCIKAVEPQAGV